MRQKSTVTEPLPGGQARGYAGAGPSEVPFAEGSDGPRRTVNPCNTHLVSRVERGALHRAHPLAQAARKQCGPGSWPSIYLYSPTSWRDCPKRVRATLRSWIWLV